MISNRDQSADHEQDRQIEERFERVRLARTAPSGYEPDEDDPAWPSRSGQAD